MHLSSSANDDDHVQDRDARAVLAANEKHAHTEDDWQYGMPRMRVVRMPLHTFPAQLTPMRSRASDKHGAGSRAHGPDGPARSPRQEPRRPE